MKSLAFKSLQTNVETNFRNKKIIQLLQEKRKVDLLRNCIVSLYESAKNTQVKFQKFVDRITPTVYKSLSKVLYRWGEFVNHQAKQDVAELFRRQRHLRRLQRLVFDGIQVYAVKQRSKNIKKKLETAHYLTNLLRTSLTKLQLNSQRRLRLKIIHGIILKKNLDNLKYAIVSQLVQKMRSSQQRNNCYDVLANKNKINLLRKCFQGFQKYETLQIKSKLIERRNQGLLVSQILQTWYIQSVKASKISNMVALLQTQYELRLMWQVLPNLKEIGWHLQQSVQMRFKQSQNLKLKCLRALKSQILLKQISKAFYDKILIRKKSQVIQSLRNYVLAKVMHRQAVDEQINIQDQEDKLILLKTCWQRLLELGFKHRAVRCARHKYVQSLLTTAIKQMRIFKFKMNWLKDKELRIQTDICHKMFKLWRSTQMNNQHELAARKVLSYPQMAKIIKQWQFVTQVWKAARLFRARWADRRLKFLTVRGLQQNTVVTQFQNMVQQRIQQQRRITLLKTGLNLFQQGLQAVKVNEQLNGLYLYNLKRVALTKLKERVHQQNKHRLALVKIRYAFQLNPRLKRPLIIIKNLLLYRTFQRLKKNCLRHSRAVKSKKISLYAQYLRLLRKSFYALRLNAANKFQEKKSREIQNLLVQRRWFNNLKRACDQRKALRKMRTDAAIFRFLKLQMKALKSIVLWFTEMKKLEVQSNFAVALYYKQLLKRGLFSLQIYRVLRKEQRCAPQIQNSYADLPCKPFDRINDENRRTNSDEIAGFFGQRSSYDIQNVSLALSDSKKYFNQETVTLGQTQQNIIKSPAEKASQEFLLSNVELGPMSPNTHSGYKKLPKTILMSLKRSSNSSYTNKVNSNDSKL